jgi:hypothetical protein
VHLETDIIIEQVHQNNEKLIAEINEYENKCSESYNQKMATYGKRTSKLLNEIDNFHSTSSNYLAGTQIDNKEAADSLTNADNYLQRLYKEDVFLNEIKYGGEVVDYVKNEARTSQSWLGTFVHKQLRIGVFEELAINSIVKNFQSDFHLLKLDSNKNVVFYIDKSNNLCVKCFDNNGNGILKKEVSNPLDAKIDKLIVINTPSGFIIFMEFSYKSCPYSVNFFGQKVTSKSGYYLSRLIYKIDHDLSG